MVTDQPQNQFIDRPGTRIRIELPYAETKAPRRVATFFKWVIKLVYSCAAGALCVALLSYMPAGQRPIAQFVPSDCAAMLRVPNGAALHRAFAESESVKQLLDDPDTGALVRELTQWTPKASERTGSVQERINAEFEKLTGHWWSSLAPSRGTDVYPLVGSECAVCFSPVDATKKAQTLLFARVRGSDGFLLRMAMPFVHLKDVEFFDLGGGLIAVGYNGARPQFGAHAQPPIASPVSVQGRAPLLSLACTPAAFAPQNQSQRATREILNTEIEAGDSQLTLLNSAGVPQNILFALLKPPTFPEMFNLAPLPEMVNVDFYDRSATEGGGIEAKGTVSGFFPPLGVSHEREESAAAARFSNFKSADTLAEFTIPVDLRALFVRYVAGEMKLTGAQRLTRRQDRWVKRFEALSQVDADPDKYLWPAAGHVIDLSVHEPKKEAALTTLGALRGWIPFKPEKPGDALFAARELARVRWDFLYEDDEQAQVKPPYVRRFGDPHSATGDFGGEYEDRYVLATSIYTPAWGLGSKGVRINMDVGSFALRGGPDSKEFPQPPAHLNAYRIKIDGARLASSAEAAVMMWYDDLEDEIGNAQKFQSTYPNHDLHIRLARKWMSAVGDFELTLKPGERGAAVRLNWRAGKVPESVATQPGKVAPRPGKNKDPDDTDVAPPPPPPPGN